MKKTIIIFYILVFVCSCFMACDSFVEDGDKRITVAVSSNNLMQKKINTDSVVKSISVPSPLILSKTELCILNSGLIDINTIDTSIEVDLKYSTVNNFLGFDVYGDLDKCYLQPDVAGKLKLSQQFLKSKFPYYSLVVYDGVRPRGIQYQMWDTIDVPDFDRSKYLSNPKLGSLHNFGAAVDVSIIDENGYELDMGTPYDYFGELAFPKEEERMNKEGKLTFKQLFNRKLLRNVMEQGGFFSIATEWWHFNSCSRYQAYSNYQIIE